MNYRDVAYAFDAEGMPVLAAWAYEISLIRDPTAIDMRLNLIAIYAASSDPGYGAAHRLDSRFVDVAFFRAKELLDDGLRLHPGNPELLAWNEHLEERVRGKPVDEALLLELSLDPHADFARLLLYIGSGRRLYSESAQRTFERAKQGDTERQRHHLSYA